MSDTTFFSASYDLWIVAASVAIATLASFVTLDLSRRVRTAGGQVNVIWWIAGSVVMGTGIWSMHFVGMLAFSLPIKLGFTGPMTLLSWIAGVLASAIALWVASQADYSVRAIASGAIAMGMSICAMHYVGMAALDMTPGIVWELQHGRAVGRHRDRGIGRRADDFPAAAARVAEAAAAGADHGRGGDGHRHLRHALHRHGGGAVSGRLGLPERRGTERRRPDRRGRRVVGHAAARHAPDVHSRSAAADRRAAAVAVAAGVEHPPAVRERRTAASCVLGRAHRPAEPAAVRDRLRQTLLRLARSNLGQGPTAERIAILFVDLDGFKPINDSYGHAAGDVLLKATADRLQKEARGSDTVARIGGDEFLLLLQGLRDIPDSLLVVQRILAALSRPFDVMGKQLQIACSIGVVVHPDQGEPDKLIANADAAMYAAKRAGGATYAMFDPNMSVDTADQLELQSDLRKAMETNQFELYYQPKIDGRRNRMSGVEALVRWNHPERGIVSPVHFIGLAERFGLIVRLGNWILNEACRQVRAWNNQGVHMRVAINLSAIQLREPTLVDRVEEALRRHGLLGAQLLCEITESVAMQDMKATQRTFEGLARIGVYLSIDDFGTGYSSLSQLRELPARQLKIDRSFVKELESKADARAVVEAVVRLAHALSLTVVAEGVETAGQREILLGLGCDELQGFFFARPMQAHDLVDWSNNQGFQASTVFATIRG